MYLVDLDNFRTNLKPLFTYNASDVKNENMYFLHARSSSLKESADFNLEH